MLRVRSPRTPDEFGVFPNDPDHFGEMVSEMWDTGSSNPDWCFLLEEGDRPVGRVGFLVEPTTTDPRWAGSLPPDELSVFGFELPWTDDAVDAGIALFEHARAALSGRIGGPLDIRVNASVDHHPDERRQVLAAIGLSLFQEKQGYAWSDDGSDIVDSGRLEFRSMDEVGVDAYRSVMAPCGEGTLDRNDHYYWNGCGADNWAAQMVAFAAPTDRDMWLIGYDGTAPVSYVAVSSSDEWGSTIAHIGVVPEARGNGYVHDLLAAANRAARRRGITTMLSDVDVLNHPMAAAMVGAGHRDDATDWHVWAFRDSMTADG